MKTRILTILLTAAILAGLLAGCRGTKTPEATATPEPTRDPHEGMIEVTDGGGGTMWIDEAENLTPFALDRYAFSVTDKIVSYSKSDATLLRGIDVSEFQGEIDWEAVAAAGIDFAIVRIGWRGYGGGSLVEDVHFRENIEGAQAAGLLVGAYFFSQAVNIMEAAEEAVFTKNLLADYRLELPVFFDWETIDVEPARTDGTPARTVTDCCVEFCKLLEAAGIRSGVYTYVPAVYRHYILNDLEGLTIWMGDPGSWPEFYYDHQIWQYSITGVIPGIEENVDLDVLYQPGGTSSIIHIPEPTETPAASDSNAETPAASDSNAEAPAEIAEPHPEAQG